MELAFNSEQQQLMDSARRFAEVYGQGQHVNPQHYNPQVWQAMVEAGWHALLVPEAQGGIGCSIVEGVAIQLGVSGGLLNSPLIVSAMTSSILQQVDTPEALSLLQKSMAEGLLVTAALLEPERRYALTPALTLAVDGDQCHLQGRKVAVHYGAQADIVLVSVLLNGKTALLSVPLAHAGVQCHEFTSIDQRPVAVLDFDVQGKLSDYLLAEEVAKAIAYGIDTAIVMLAAEVVTLTDSMVEQTIGYCKQRQQFDQPISSFQIIQHRLVDMYIASQSLRSLLYAATAKMAEQSDDASRSVALLKIQMGTLSRWIAENAVQSHGAIGYTEELKLNGYYKRVVAADKWFGDSHSHLSRLIQM